MITIVITSVSAVVLGVSLALWDATRRALAMQVRLGELRVEAMRRHDLEAMSEQLAVNAAEIASVRRDLQALDSSLALGRRR